MLCPACKENDAPHTIAAETTIRLSLELWDEQTPVLCDRCGTMHILNSCMQDPDKIKTAMARWKEIAYHLMTGMMPTPSQRLH